MFITLVGRHSAFDDALVLAAAGAIWQYEGGEWASLAQSASRGQADRRERDVEIERRGDGKVRKLSRGGSIWATLIFEIESVGHRTAYTKSSDNGRG